MTGARAGQRPEAAAGDAVVWAGTCTGEAGPGELRNRQTDARQTDARQADARQASDARRDATKQVFICKRNSM